MELFSQPPSPTHLGILAASKPIPAVGGDKVSAIMAVFRGCTYIVEGDGGDDWGGRGSVPGDPRLTAVEHYWPGLCMSLEHGDGPSSREP